jgi:hypothetical protein
VSTLAGGFIAFLRRSPAREDNDDCAPRNEVLINDMLDV